MTTKKTEIMNPDNEDWNLFSSMLGLRMYSHQCDARTFTQAIFILKEFFPCMNITKSLKCFRENGGFCDCEILFNVEDSYES